MSESERVSKVRYAFRTRLVGLLFFISIAASSLAQVKDVRVRVVDDKNRPVAGVRVATNWSFGNDGWESRYEVTTDGQGRASGAWNVPSYGAIIVATAAGANLPTAFGAAVSAPAHLAGALPVGPPRAFSSSI